MLVIINYLSKKTAISKEEYKTYLLLLAPFAPHITEELWSVLGMEYSIHQQVWPKYDEKYLEEAQAAVVIQVNGKLRDSVNVPAQGSKIESEIEKLALQSEKVKNFIGGRKIKNTIFVPGKLINFVV